jgi:hypothetical protein
MLQDIKYSSLMTYIFSDRPAFSPENMQFIMFLLLLFLNNNFTDLKLNRLVRA